MNKVDLKKLTSIEDDFALWAAEQGALIRARKFDRADFDNIAEELEDLGRSVKYEIRSRLEVLLAHLLKWQFQPGKRTNSWKATIVEQRVHIADLLNESPSLKPYPATVIDRAYVIGLNSAITETGLSEAAFPETCPYTAVQALDMDFWPGGKDMPSLPKRRQRTASA
jgi:hypothetical protein